MLTPEIIYTAFFLILEDWPKPILIEIMATKNLTFATGKDFCCHDFQLKKLALTSFLKSRKTISADNVHWSKGLSVSLEVPKDPLKSTSETLKIPQKSLRSLGTLEE